MILKVSDQPTEVAPEHFPCLHADSIHFSNEAAAAGAESAMELI